MTRYTKTYSSPSQLVSLLQSRGLHVESVARTESYLHHISYYRFSAYLYPLLTTPKENHVFKPGVTFNQALDMYRFDRHLRLLMFNEIEKIEVSVRSAIANITSRETGNPFWMTDPSCFYDANTFAKTMQLIDVELAKSREDFIEYFRNTYSDPYPPAGQADIIVCPSKLLYHVQCPGCGITRATLKFLHFDITGAFRLNPNVVLSVLFIFLSPIVLLIDFMANKNISFKLYSSVDALLHKRFVWIPFLLIELSIWIHNIWSDI